MIKERTKTFYYSITYKKILNFFRQRVKVIEIFSEKGSNWRDN